MIRERHLRFISALLVLFVGAYTIARATTILSFARADASIEPDKIREKYGPFVDQPPVSYLARQRLTRLVPAEDGTQRIDELSDLLAETPADSISWLDLAKARAAENAGADKVVKALAMSSLTGPNESRIMAGRALFVFPLWSTMPPEARRAFAADVVGGWGSLTHEQRTAFRSNLQTEPEEMRQQIVAGLLLMGKEGTAVGRALGVLPAPGTKTK
jgi:hypothetical protein